MDPSVFVILLAICTVVHGQIKLDPSGVDGSKMMSFKTPVLTEEESESNFMPANLQCDACNAVVFQFHKNFEEFNSKHKVYKFKLPESEIIDVVEKVCHHETYNNYGVKEVDGVKLLSGEGLEGEKAPGMLAGGGKWPARLADTCSRFVEELAETEIYDLYLKGRSSVQEMQKLMCHGEGVLGKCTKKRKLKKMGHTEL